MMMLREGRGARGEGRGRGPVLRSSSRPAADCRLPTARGGFTLIELLVVIFIILLVSVLALPVVLPAFNHRQVSEAGRLLQGALIGARDSAIHKNQPGGIRLLPDPTYPITWTASGTITTNTILAYNRIVPIDAAPEYSEGLCTPVPVTAVAANTGISVAITPTVSFAWTHQIIPPALILVENPTSPANNNLPNPPTSWFWNIRVGDKVQINNAGPWYTVVGPMSIGPGSAGSSNSEMFVNVGPAGPLSSYGQAVPFVNGSPAEYLVLVNGQDDNNNGWIDEGADGVDNNGNGNIDEFLITNNGIVSEWETEQWLGAITAQQPVNVPYTIQRRPVPSANAREVPLPTSMVIDATSYFLTQERSRLPVNPYTGYVDIVINPDGTLVPTVQYSSPSSFGMGSAFYHFWLSERQDLADVQLGTNGTPQPWATGAPYHLPIAQPGGNLANSSTLPGPYLKGEYSVLTLFTRTGQIAVNQGVPFLYDATIGYSNQTGTYNVNSPFIQAEQGLSGGR